MCDCCGFIGAWMPRVRYGHLVLRLCRSCYELYLRAMYPAIYDGASRILPPLQPRLVRVA